MPHPSLSTCVYVSCLTHPDTVPASTRMHHHHHSPRTPGPPACKPVPSVAASTRASMQAASIRSSSYQHAARLPTCPRFSAPEGSLWPCAVRLARYKSAKKCRAAPGGSLTAAWAVESGAPCVRWRRAWRELAPQRLHPLHSPPHQPQRPHPPQPCPSRQRSLWHSALSSCPRVQWQSQACLKAQQMQEVVGPRCRHVRDPAVVVPLARSELQVEA